MHALRLPVLQVLGGTIGLVKCDLNQGVGTCEVPEHAACEVPVHAGQFRDPTSPSFPLIALGGDLRFDLLKIDAFWAH